MKNYVFAQTSNPILCSILQARFNKLGTREYVVVLSVSLISQQVEREHLNKIELARLDGLRRVVPACQAKAASHKSLLTWQEAAKEKAQRSNLWSWKRKHRSVFLEDAGLEEQQLGSSRITMKDFFWNLGIGWDLKGIKLNPLLFAKEIFLQFRLPDMLSSSHSSIWWGLDGRKKRGAKHAGTQSGRSHGGSPGRFYLSCVCGLCGPFWALSRSLGPLGYHHFFVDLHNSTFHCRKKWGRYDSHMARAQHVGCVWQGFLSPFAFSFVLQKTASGDRRDRVIAIAVQGNWRLVRERINSMPNYPVVLWPHLFQKSCRLYFSLFARKRERFSYEQLEVWAQEKEKERDERQSADGFCWESEHPLEAVRSTLEAGGTALGWLTGSNANFCFGLLWFQGASISDGNGLGHC